MALIGLTKRNPMCKICTSFDDDTLNEITLDILLNRKTIDEIKEHYSKLLPDIVPPLSSSNINSHKRHSDPALIAEDVLRKKGEAITPGDHAAVEYAKRFQGVFDKHETLKTLYLARINSIQFLRDILDDKKKEYAEESKKEMTLSRRSNLKRIENEIRDLTNEIDEIERDIQRIIVQEKKVEMGPGNTYINQNFVNIFEGSLKNFMNDLVPYLLYNIFHDDIDKGKEVVAQISSFMDQHLSPSLNKLNKQLNMN